MFREPEGTKVFLYPIPSDFQPLPPMLNPSPPYLVGIGPKHSKRQKTGYEEIVEGVAAVYCVALTVIEVTP